MLPGYVQTPAYTRQLLRLQLTPEELPDDEIDALVAQRARRQEVLYEPGRKVSIVVGEAALRSRPGAISTMISQLDRLLTVAGLPAVEFCVIPVDAPMPAIPLSGFRLLDQDVAIVESLAGEQRLYEPAEVAGYVRTFSKLRAGALSGPPAFALIQRVAREMQQQ